MAAGQIPSWAINEKITKRKLSFLKMCLTLLIPVKESNLMDLCLIAITDLLELYLLAIQIFCHIKVKAFCLCRNRHCQTSVLCSFCEQDMAIFGTLVSFWESYSLLFNAFLPKWILEFFLIDLLLVLMIMHANFSSSVSIYFHQFLPGMQHTRYPSQAN